MVAGPRAVAGSIRKLIWRPPLKMPNRPDGRVTPALSVISRLVPESVSGSGVTVAMASAPALRTKAVPIIEGVRQSGMKLPPLTVPRCETWGSNRSNT